MPSKATDGPLLSLLETRGGTLKLPFPAHTQCSVTHTCTQISSAAATRVSHATPPIRPAPSSSPSPSDPLSASSSLQSKTLKQPAPPTAHRHRRMPYPPRIPAADRPPMPSRHPPSRRGAGQRVLPALGPPRPRCCTYRLSATRQCEPQQGGQGSPTDDQLTPASTPQLPPPYRPKSPRRLQPGTRCPHTPAPVHCACISTSQRPTAAPRLEYRV